MVLVVEEAAEILKGTANHYRLKILQLLEKNPQLTVEEITEKLNANYKTISVHVRKLHHTGLITKKYRAQAIEHSLTARGQTILKFLGILE